MNKAKRYSSFAEFWPFYVREHSKPLTRRLHFIGTVSLFPLLVFALFSNLYVLFLLPLAGYGFAWYAHYYVEKIKPATFKYPLWSLLADFKMFYLMLTGKMDSEIRRCCERENN